jgi:hypothetical protein
VDVQWAQNAKVAVSMSKHITRKKKKKAAHQNFQTRAYEKETWVSGIMGMTCLRAI